MCFFPIISLCHSLGGVCINVASSSVHSLSCASLPENKAHLMQHYDVIRREPCTTVNVCFSCPPWLQNTHIPCKLKLSRLSCLWISTSHTFLSIVVLSLSLYLSTYLDVFSEWLVIKLFCIYGHLNTNSIFLRVYVIFFSLVFVFIHFNTSLMCWGHNCYLFKESLLLVWTVFEGIQLKLKYIRQCFLGCFCFKGQCLKVFLIPKFYNNIPHDTLLLI